MLQIIIPPCEIWDEQNEEFLDFKGQTLQLEHSLVSLSKWESKWNKPFLLKEEKTLEEIIDYIRCMTLTKNVDPNAYKCLTGENIEQVNNYINAPMTATTFNNRNGKPDHTVKTAEVIYYLMIGFGIPFECQKWHLNRLLTLIRVCDLKNSPPKKMSSNDLAARYKAINEANKKKYNTRG